MGADTFRHQSSSDRPSSWGAARSRARAPDAEARARLRAELRAALPVYGTVLVNEPRRGTLAPVLHIGAANRPDVRDFLRVHRQDCPAPAEGDARSQVYVVTDGPSGAPVAFVRFDTLRPARCAFAVALRVGRHDAALAALARGGVLGITLDPPRVAPDGLLVGPTLFLDVAGREVLAAALRGWQNGGRHVAR